MKPHFLEIFLEIYTGDTMVTVNIFLLSPIFLKYLLEIYSGDTGAAFN